MAWTREKANAARRRQYKEDTGYREAKLAYQKTPEAKESARRRHREKYSLRKKTPEYRLKVTCRMYGITVEQFWKVFQHQGGKCATCSAKLDPHSRVTNKDHNHDTKRFRGLLCSLCNTTLGHLERLKFNTTAFKNYIDNPPANIL